MGSSSTNYRRATIPTSSTLLHQGEANSSFSHPYPDFIDPNFNMSPLLSSHNSNGGNYKDVVLSAQSSESLPSALGVSYTSYSSGGDRMKHVVDMDEIDLNDLIGGLGGIHMDKSLSILNDLNQSNANDSLLLKDVCVTTRSITSLPDNSTRDLSLELGLGLSLNNFCDSSTSILHSSLLPSVGEDCFLLSDIGLGLHSQSISVTQAEALLREDDELE
jgi:hypothetical protein